MGLPNEFYEEMSRIDRDRVDFQRNLDEAIKELVYFYFPEIINAPRLVIKSIKDVINTFSMEVWNNCETASYKVKSYSKWRLEEELKNTGKLNWGFPRNTQSGAIDQNDEDYFETLTNDIHHEKFFEMIYQKTVEVIENSEKKSFKSSPNEIVLLMRYLLMSCHGLVGSFYEEANEYIRDPYYAL